MQPKTLDIVSSTITNNKEKILLFIKHTAGPLSVSTLKQDCLMRPVITYIYGMLPFPVRIVIRQKQFVEFFMKNKKYAIRLLEPLFESYEHNKTSPIQTFQNQEAANTARNIAKPAIEHETHLSK